MTKTVYTSVTNKSGDIIKIAGMFSEEHQQVLVYPTGKDFTYGWYNIDRFTDGKLTATTLKNLFTT